MPIRVTVWGENVHEQKNKAVADNYPIGMHGQIAEQHTLFGELGSQAALDGRTIEVNHRSAELRSPLHQRADRPGARPAGRSDHAILIRTDCAQIDPFELLGVQRT